MYRWAFKSGTIFTDLTGVNGAHGCSCEKRLWLSHGLRNGYLEMVKYLLMSPNLKEHADIHANNDYEFRHACENGNLELVKFLLTSPELEEHSAIRADDSWVLTWILTKEEVNFAIQWVRNWHQANQESEYLNWLVAAESAVKKGKKNYNFTCFFVNPI